MTVPFERVQPLNVLGPFYPLSENVLFSRLFSLVAGIEAEWLFC